MLKQAADAGMLLIVHQRHVEDRRHIAYWSDVDTDELDDLLAALS